MSILFVLLTFLVIISINYFRLRGVTPTEVKVPVLSHPSVPKFIRELGFEVPQGYAFHPGHTWAIDEGRQNVRVGLDDFSSNVLGKIDSFKIRPLNRWVRQGQKLFTITCEGIPIDVVSPVEGVLTDINHDVVQNPNLIIEDPYRKGWICTVKAFDIVTDIKNLLRGSLVVPWLQNSTSRVASIANLSQPVLAQDGGHPIKGVLGHLDPESQRKLVKEIFLT